ncbi:TRAP transporter small permease [Polyangium mundeleinium]|uniref:TRAP transporter small permease subunit n=1 Tax=Polyangium mundeleinium TaxID=2995306 RepID=A0ABT5EPH7_9BACT|nr:TRAP transporter small permease subunit [Polyangium mundeleinium]MDC0743747.1 TRAP transporter small permease subunit [Polyangium mundeleinium]
MAGEPDDEGQGDEKTQDPAASKEPSETDASEGTKDGDAGETSAQPSAQTDASEGTKDGDAGETSAQDEGAKTSAEPPRVGAAWALPFVRIERALTWFESRVLFVVLLALVLSLVIWISLRGLASPVQADNAAGTVFRGLLGATVLGALARFGTTRAKIHDETKRAIVTIVAMAIGAAVAPAWRKVGVDHFDAILNWLQEGSALTLFGGLRGVATRLTLLAALIGSSLAAARSKHINIDVVLRFMPPSLRKPVHVLGALVTATVCFAASWGFFDYISIEGFGQRNDLSASAKFVGVREGSSRHFFLLRKQIGLDLRAAPSVIFSGVRWDDPSRMNGRAWNTWIDESGFSEKFTAEEVELMRAPKGSEEAPRVPVVVLPSENVRGLLLTDMNLMWTFGLFVIGLRVLLRVVLVIAGHASVEQDADEPDEDTDEPRGPVAEEGAR